MVVPAFSGVEPPDVVTSDATPPATALMYPNSDGVGLETVDPIGYEKFAFTDIGFPKIWVPAGYAKFGVCDVTGMLVAPIAAPWS
jgi:hypothetical protein